MTDIWPNVSVCTILFNHAHCVTDCIKGVQQQVYDGKIQHVIADDKSTDETRQVVRNSVDANSPVDYRIIEQDSNVGMNQNLIDALSACNGDYIALCEGDDFWIDPNKIRRQVCELERSPDIPMSTHDCYRIYHPSEKHRTLRRGLKMFYWDARAYGPYGVINLLASLAKGKQEFWSKDRCKLEYRRRRRYHLKHFIAGSWIQPFCSILMRRQLAKPLIECLRLSEGGHQLTLLLGAIFGGIIHDRRPMAKIRILNQSFETNNRIKRYKSILAYCNTDQEQMVHRMIYEYIKKTGVSSD